MSVNYLQMDVPHRTVREGAVAQYTIVDRQKQTLDLGGLLHLLQMENQFAAGPVLDEFGIRVDAIGVTLHVL
jgi:hypothetical protein